MNKNPIPGQDNKRTFSNTMGYIDIFPKREMWRQIGEEFGGKSVISLTSCNEIEIHRMNIPYKKWEIKISESDTRPLKFEVDFNCPIDFELVLGCEDFIEKILKRLGKKEFTIGNERFDNQYLIQGDNHELIKQILAPEICDFSCKGVNKRKKSNLITVISRTIDEKSVICELVGMHQKFLDRLESVLIID